MSDTRPSGKDAESAKTEPVETSAAKVREGSFFDNATTRDHTAKNKGDHTVDSEGEQTRPISVDEAQSEDLSHATSTRVSHSEDDATAVIDTEKTEVQEPETRAQGTDARSADTRSTDASGTEKTAVQPAVEDPEEARHRETERRRRERDEALGRKRQPKPAAAPEPEPVRQTVRSTDKAFGSLGLFLFRIVVGALMGLHGLAKVMDMPSTTQMVESTPLGQLTGQGPLLAYVLAIGELLIAVSLIFGFLTRYAGLALAAITIMALAFVHWTGMPFEGYTLNGELELLLAVSGILFFALGSGGWAADRALRRNREIRKEDKARGRDSALS